MGMIKPLILTFKEMFRRPKTVKYPYEKREISPRVRNIHTLDRSICHHCGLCAKICPNDVLKMVDGFPTADYRACSYCGICVDVCPTDALQMIHVEEGRIVRGYVEELYTELLNPDGTVYRAPDAGGDE